MQLTRRAALGLLTLTVAGCAADPADNHRRSKSPGPSATATNATGQRAVDATSLASLAALAAFLRSLEGLDAWKNKDWATAARRQVRAHLTFFTLPDPFSGDVQGPYPVPTARQSVPASSAKAASQLDALAKKAVAALSASAEAASTPALRLAWASAATATAGLTSRAVSPVKGSATPASFSALEVRDALDVAISHSWALIYGLNVGLGQLPKSDALWRLGANRMVGAKELRNELRAAYPDGADVPQQPAAFALPNEMSSAADIRKGWAQLERNLLDGYAVLVAADSTAPWLRRMRGQVGRLAALRAPVTRWPGWVA